MRAIRWVALVIVLFGAFYLWGALQIRESTTYAAVGPRFMPNAIGIGIVLSGVWLFAFPGAPPAPDSPEAASLDWLSIGLMLGLVAVYIALFRVAGYVLATTLLLWGGRANFRRPPSSRARRRDCGGAVGDNLLRLFAIIAHQPAASPVGLLRVRLEGVVL